MLPYYGRLPTGEPLLHSPFWSRVYRLGTRLFLGDAALPFVRREDWARACFGQIAWTNVFKIGGSCGGNPPSEMRELLLSNFSFLGDEIEIIKPRIVVFSTGSGYDQILSRSVGMEVDLEPDRNAPEIAALRTRTGRLGYRTPHFQRLRNQDLDRLCALALHFCFLGCD